MSHYSGSAVYWSFGGTVCSTDFKSVDWEETIKLIDTTAGADVAESHVTGTTKATFSWSALFEDAAAGSAFARALDVGNSGTLIFAPLGTAVGKPKFSFVATSDTLAMKAPYDDALEWTGSLTRNGDWVTSWAALGSSF